MNLTDKQRSRGPVGRRIERDVSGRPTCWECGEGMDVSWWRGVVGYRSRPMYRPHCARCLGSDARRGPVVPCTICDHPLSYCDPVPERRGMWRTWLDICSIECLNIAKEEREPPHPEPRRCAWCGHEFTPLRRSDAKFCGSRCRQAKRRAEPVCDYDSDEVQALLDELGLDSDRVLTPLYADVLADALNELWADPHSANP